MAIRRGDSLKVRDLHLICESPKWILRYAQYDGKVDCHDLLKASLAMTKYFRFQATSAEVALGKFVGFQARNYEIELMVHRIV